MQHVIKNQIIQLKLNNSHDAFQIQNRISERYLNDIVPLMETLFDEAGDEDESIFIDKLEIDLGVLSEKDFHRQAWDEEQLAPMIEQLRSLLAKYSNGAQDESKKNSVSLSTVRQWLFYMQHGYLPWNTLQTGRDWKEKVLKTIKDDQGSISQLCRIIRLDGDVVIRIVEQHDEVFLLRLMEILTDHQEKYLSGVLNELEMLYLVLSKESIKNLTHKKSEIRKSFLEVMFRILADSDSRGKDPQTFLQQIMVKSFPRKIRSRDLPKKTQSKLLRLMPIIKEMEDKAVVRDSNIFSEVLEETELHKNGHTKKKETSELEEDGLFVSLAGAVLLHPFLSTLFNRLELTQARTFKTIEAEQKALYLIHYLCTGTAEAEEHKLVIPKILCGYPLKKPVRKGIPLSEKDKEEANHLLEELIQRWNKLKNTSVAGLREGFLQRGGKLVTQNDMWCIQVETETIDLLLDHLPWNLSIIKLPWVKDIIRVEWR